MFPTSLCWEFYHHIFDLFLYFYERRVVHSFFVGIGINILGQKSEQKNEDEVEGEKKRGVFTSQLEVLLCGVASSGRDKNSERRTVFKVLSLRTDGNTGEVKRTGNTALWHISSWFFFYQTVILCPEKGLQKSSFLGMKDSFPNINTWKNVCFQTL